MANLITPDDYLPELTDGFASQEEKQDHQFAKTAENLSNRREYSAADSFDEFTGAPTLDLEVELQQVQQELHHTTNALKQIQLSKRAEEIAAQIVQAEAEAEGKEPLSGDELDNSVSELLSVYGQEVVDNTLQWAAEGVSTDVAEAANEALAAGGEESIAAFNALKSVSELPQEAVVRDGTPELFSQDVSARLSEEYGQAGDHIAALNAALVAGKCTRAEAARIAASDPRIMMAAFDAARKGIITLAL